MEVKKTIKKVVAIGTGAVMVGATILGAMAAADKLNLANYPDTFVTDGKFNGLFVVGAKALAEDTIGLNSFSTNMFYMADAGSTTTTVEGDSALLSKTGDVLEVYEKLGEVKDVLTDKDLVGLKSGKISTSQGTTDYNQYLRFRNGTAKGDFNSGQLVFADNGYNNQKVGDFLKFTDGTVAYEYELEFSQGAESRIDSNNKLNDLEDKSINILGKTYSIVNTAYTTDDLTIDLMAGDVADTLEEGETKTYTIAGTDYTVEVLIISDQSSAAASVKLSVNGEVTDKMSDGDTYRLADGVELGIRDILPNEAGEESGGDLVSFYLGANKLSIRDTNVSDSAFYSGVEINDESVSDGTVKITASKPSTTKLKINDLRYQLEVNSKEGDVYIESGHKFSEYLNEPLGMLHNDWDVTYQGLSEEESTTFKLMPSGDDKYRIIFTNINGEEYDFDFMDNSAGALTVGRTGKAFHWVEDGTNISRNDYFLVSDNSGSPTSDDTAVTKVLRFSAIDTTNSQLTFQDAATGGGTYECTYSSSTCTLIVAGNSYKVNVMSTTDKTVRVDFDGDGTLQTDGSDYATLVLKGGHIVSLGTSDTSGSYKQLVLRTLSKNFDENGARNSTGTVTAGDETWTINVTAGSATNTIDSSIVANQFFTTVNDPDNSDYQYAMTSFGTKIEKWDDSSANNRAARVTVDWPVSQRSGEVYVTTGATSTTSSNGKQRTRVDVDVAAAVTDAEVGEVSAQNLIVVGGPCANTVAAQIMGSSDNCAEGFEEGKAVIKLKQFGDNVAMLVAGYTATDTRRASLVLAEYDQYALSGAEVSVDTSTAKPTVATVMSQ
ncbi:hypothetical protein HZB01_00205 [Candidatus Woesearchaeota archaeon]|nr:hypothetical protein [Candidatus Woesearchaeota archaeon]